MSLDRIPAQPLTAEQKSALKRLHTAATQLEGVFLDQLFSAMRATVPKESLFGKESSAEETFQTMLDAVPEQKTLWGDDRVGVYRVTIDQLRTIRPDLFD